MNIEKICEIENMNPNEVEVELLPDNSTVILNYKKRKYAYFLDEAKAKKYTVNLCESLFDDLNEKQALEVLEISLQDYFKTVIKYDGIEKLLSYDSKHKIILEDNSLCFRMI